MLLDAEKSGRIKPGDTLIEPTSRQHRYRPRDGRRRRGYRMIITMPEKMSREKQVVLEALGAEIIRTPTEAAWDAPESHIGVANRLQEVLPNSHILDQYGEPLQPEGAQRGHGARDPRAVRRQARRGRRSAPAPAARSPASPSDEGGAAELQDHRRRPGGLDPRGPEEIRSYKVEGIGYDFIPDVLDRSASSTAGSSRRRRVLPLARS
jgi:cystathionine beta-synthase